MRCLLSFFFFFPRLPFAEHLRDTPERQLRPPDRRSGNAGGRRRGRERNGGVSGDDTPSSGIVGNEALGGGGVDAVASLVMSRCQGERAQSKIHVTGRDAVAAVPTRLSVAFFFFVGDSCRLTLLTAAPARKTSVFVAASHLPAAFYFLTNTNAITVGDFFFLLFSSSTG